MIQASTSVKVRFAETDAMGIVYHANYLPWCEVARLALMESIGLSYKVMNENGQHLPVVEAHLKYKYPAKFDDNVEIIATIKEKPSIKVVVEYQMFANNKLLIEGKTVHAFVNSKGIPIKPPKEVIDIMLEAWNK